MGRQDRRVQVAVVERTISARASLELARRATRAPDHVAENRALLDLARDLAATPQRILQRMADVALGLCRAHSAGFSLLTEDGKRFYWAAIAGRWAQHVGGGTPREFGPCGMVLDSDDPLLFWHPETTFPYLAEARPCIDEGLLLPFHVAGKAVGTIWVISHDESRRFDREDLRVMTSLATFASAAYQAQRDSEHRFRAIVETTPECVKLLARDGALLEMNSAGLRMIAAARPEDVIGKSVYDLIAPEHREAFRTFNERVCDGERGTLEFDLIDLVGTRHSMETHAVPLRALDGATVHLALTRDITERRKTEQLLRDADRRKDEFIATLSHELRNPLAPLRTGLTVLRLQGGTEDKTRRIHDVMDRQLDHLVRLVDDLLEVSRITSGTIELKRERLDLAAVVRSAVEASSPVVDGAGHALELKLPGQPIEVEGDRVRLAQVFSNLINNAARFTEGRGRITIAVGVENGRARVCVRDTGRGFDPERAEVLFQMFARGGNSTGLGIGLALSRRLARLHDGDIEARSAGEGRGAEFIVRLPIAPAARNGARTSSESPEVHGQLQARRVLVADDNEDSADMLATLIRTLGGDVRVALDGEEAVEAAISFRPEVAVLDIGMPKIDGYEAARRIRNQLGQNGPKLIALTGWGQESDRRRARDAGFDAHLVKPFDLDVLRQLLVAAK